MVRLKTKYQKVYEPLESQGRLTKTIPTLAGSSNFEIEQSDMILLNNV